MDKKNIQESIDFNYKQIELLKLEKRQIDVNIDIFIAEIDRLQQSLNVL